MTKNVKLQRSRSGFISVISSYNEKRAEIATSNDLVYLKGNLKGVQITLKNFQTVCEQLLQSEDELSEKFFSDNAEKEAICEVVIETYLSRIKELEPTPSVPTSTPNSDSASASKPASIKLETLKMEKFDGSPIKYQTFWDRWKARYHDNSSLSDVHRFEYFLQHLEGDALSALAGLPPTSENYAFAIETIQRRFGKIGPRINAHVNAILRLPEGGNDRSVKKLRNLVDTVNTNLRALRSMQVLSASSQEVSAILGPIIFSRLPTFLCRRWYELHNDGVIQVDQLTEFIQNQVESLEMAELCLDKDSRHEKPHKTTQEQQLFTTTLHTGTTPKTSQHPSKLSKPGGHFSLQPGPSTGQQGTPQPRNDKPPPCPFCQAQHYPGRCSKARKLPSSEVINVLKKNQRCLCCLKFGHRFEQCSFKPVCNICRGNHMPIVCAERKVDTQTTSANCVFHGTDNGNPINVLLPTATVKGAGKSRSSSFRILLDSASQSSFIERNLAKHLNLKKIGRPHVSVETFGAAVTVPEPTNLYEIVLYSREDSTVSLKIHVLETCSISRSYQQFPDTVTLASYPHLRGLSFADQAQNSSPVGLLVGADYYSKIVQKDPMIDGESGPTALPTLFGWALIGPTSPLEENSPQFTTSVKCVGTSPIIGDQLRQFFSMERYSFADVIPSTKSEELKPNLHRVNTGRYELLLPFKEVHPPLLSTAQQAKRRFDLLQRRLQKDPTLAKLYDEALDVFIKRGFIERVPDDELFKVLMYHMPHHPVVKESSKTYKVRPVFNASCRGPSGVSLNDCLETGPSLLPEIPDLLLRIRSMPIVISSDIEKAFLQLLLDPSQRDLCRIFWKDSDGNVVQYRFRVICFGLVSAPWLLNATIQHHYSIQLNSDAVEEMKINTYMDNVFQGASSVDEAIEKASLAKDIFSDACMQLSQWSSNSLEVESSLSSKGFIVDKDPLVKVLGLGWNKRTDTFYVRNVPPVDGALTKRNVLSQLAKIFDPLGFFAFVTVRGKLLLQSFWSDKLDWDDVITDPHLLVQIEKFLDETTHLEDYPFPRYPFQGSESTKQIHIFCDSSNKISVCCAYLREESSSGEISSHFLISKNKIVPINASSGSDATLSIARKELVACLMGARLGHRLSSALDINAITFWTDSQISLWWIRRPQKKVPIFVQNRVSQILALTEATSWNYIPTSDNPSDIPTREFPLSKLSTSALWKHGPPWLTSHPQHWPSSPPFDPPNVVKALHTVSIEVPEESSSIIDKVLSHYETLEKAVTPVAWWLRYINVLRSKIKGEVFSKPKNLTFQEREDALHTLIRIEQRRVYPTEFEALSTGKKCLSSSTLFSLKPAWDNLHSYIVSIGRERPLQPLVLIPKKSNLARLLLTKYHYATFHGGSESTLARSREKYWIVHGRVIAKQVIRSCPTCKVFSAKPYQQVESALPPSRVSKSAPFEVCGCDYMGPLHTASQGKCYVVLFTCAVVRAVHIEVVPDQGARTFIDAFRRFQARRIRPKIMYSDNAPTFVLVSEVFKDIDWRFIPEYSPWWGDGGSA